MQKLAQMSCNLFFFIIWLSFNFCCQGDKPKGNGLNNCKVMNFNLLLIIFEL